MSLINPIPGSGWHNNGGYDADTGLDILVPMGTRCVAAAEGTVEYCERGHTAWLLPDGQYPYSCRIRLAKAIQVGNVTYRFIWYTHMEDANPALKDRYEVPVTAGLWVGLTGSGNGVPHLHFGVVADRPQTVTLPWRDVALLIWGQPNAAVAATTPPAHPSLRKKHVKLFVHDDAKTIIVDGRSFPLDSVDADMQYEEKP
jgi:hypothetical protein